ncbi:MAG: hypothetical protein ACYDEO_22780 [Aggregatilineales bacterium]
MQHGKTVMILDENEQAVQLVPVTAAQKPRKAGSARARTQIADLADETRLGSTG